MGIVRMIRLLLVFSIVAVTVITALEHVDKFREGSCSQILARPTKVSRKFVDSLKYIPAASRYHCYRAASQMPNFSSMREDEFYYDFCYGRNTTSTEPIGASIGFGRVLATYRVVTRAGIYVEGIPTNPSQSWDTHEQIVTLTDNKSFAVLVTCWTGVNQRSWNVISLTPKIDSSARKMIEEHVASLGFKRENFVFLRYDSCRRWGGSGSLIDGDIRNRTRAHVPFGEPPALRRATLQRLPGRRIIF